MRVLDLFCGAGGITAGWQQAGAYVVGVDIEPQPNYCGDEFYQADALEFPLDGYDVILASPPCQRWSEGAIWRGTSCDHPDTLTPTRQRLQNWGGVYVLENVTRAPMINPILLCGTMFPGLRVFRHRLFESNHLLHAPPHPPHKERIGWGPDDFVTVAGHGGDGPNSYQARADAMMIDWMTYDELADAIPPAYAEFIARQIIGIPLGRIATRQPVLL